MGLLMSLKTVNMTFFFFFFTEESMFTHLGMSFRLRLIFEIISNTAFEPFVDIFLTKTRFPVHISHSSVTFTCFALVNNHEFDDRPLFKPEKSELIFNHFK